MKYLPHIGLPLLMVLLLVGAIFLPKYVKKQETSETDVSEMSYEEMRSALVESGAIEDIPIPEPEPVAETPETEAAVVVKADAPKPSLPAVPEISLDQKLEPFFSAVEAEDFPKARKTLEDLGDEIPSGMVGGLKATIASAEASQKALADSAKQLKAKNAQLESAQDRVAKIENESIQRIESSVKNLEAATAAAQKAASEAVQLREKISEIGAMPAATKVAKNADVKKAAPAPKVAPAKLPENKSVTFSFDSSSIPSSMAAVIKSSIAELKKEAGLKVQLRGHADKKGNAAYNGMLSKARAESVKDQLIEGGIQEQRIEIISYGESQSAEESDSSKARRVDLVFRSL